MYVRLSTDGSAHPVATADIDTDLSGTLLRARLCDVGAVDRTTGLVRDPTMFVEVDRQLIAAITAERAEPALDDRVVALLVHARSGRAVVTGPFESRTSARAWWDLPNNELARSSCVLFVVFRY